MALNGAGVFVRLYNWATDRDGGIKIRADRMDAELDGIATGLSTALFKDGQQVATANQPMGTFRHTGVGAAVSRTDYARVAETQDSTYAWGGTDTGAADAYVFSTSPVIVAYVAGQKLAGKIGAAHTSTGIACTANFGPGTKTIKMSDGTAPPAGAMTAARSYEWLYDGTNLILLNPAWGVLLYPIGSIYISVNSTNPGTSLGFGTWTAFGAGRVPVGFSSGETEFDTDEETGGEKTHTLITAETPAHTHTFAARVSTDPTVHFTDAGGNSAGPQVNATSSTGGDGAHNNLQPYIVVRMWKRTA